MNLSKITKDLPHYLPIFGIYTAGLLSFWQFSYDKNFQAGTIISIGFAHIVWGVVHHYIHKDLCLEVFMEYVMIAILGVSAVLVMIYS